MAVKINARLQVKSDTTANWNAARGFIPLKGEVIVYTDYRTKVVDGETVTIPGVKIGTGNAYVQDLMFINDGDSQQILDHISNTNIHTSSQEKDYWNNKISLDYSGLDSETLIFTTD